MPSLEMNSVTLSLAALDTKGVAQAGRGLSLDPDRRPTETACWLLVVSLRLMQPRGGPPIKCGLDRDTTPQHRIGAKISPAKWWAGLAEPGLKALSVPVYSIRF